MPNYNYLCTECAGVLKIELGRDPTELELLENAIFETKHAMNPTEAELKDARMCPRCDSLKTEKTMIDAMPYMYMAGHGYKDKAGLHRDMNLYHLQNDDPYSYMRQRGEVDDLTLRLKRGSKKPEPPLGTVHVLDPVTHQWIDKATNKPVENSSDTKNIHKDKEK